MTAPAWQALAFAAAWAAAAVLAFHYLRRAVARLTRLTVALRAGLQIMARDVRWLVTAAQASAPPAGPGGAESRPGRHSGEPGPAAAESPPPGGLPADVEGRLVMCRNCLRSLQPAQEPSLGAEWEHAGTGALGCWIGVPPDMRDELMGRVAEPVRACTGCGRAESFADPLTAWILNGRRVWFCTDSGSCSSRATVTG